jgi:hypothetical protein
MSTSTTGTVTNIKVRQDGLSDACWVTLLDSQTKQSELFVVWNGNIGQPTPFSVWIARSLVVSLLKEALLNKLSVNVTHDDDSALIRWFELLGS